MYRTVGLQDIGSKVVLIKKANSHIGYDVQRNYARVVQMDAVIKTYWDIHATDLEDRLGIGQDKLPASLSISTLLNPLLGLKPRIVCSSLMSDCQYSKAKMELLHKMQDILDTKCPLAHESSEESKHDRDDELLPNGDNVNFN